MGANFSSHPGSQPPTTSTREGSMPQQDSACPVPEPYRNPAVFNVYSQRVNDPACPIAGPQMDPRNNMPLEPNQQPAPGQRALISTSREQSAIPKGGTDGTWLYPSPQMFFNALRRKGKDDGVEERDMEVTVQAHNAMNEMTWRHVMAWEQMHCTECKSPTLLRFCGRPDELSPLARVAAWRTGHMPFDRHDWYVDRCGKEVRYVIDFYFNEDKAGTPEAFRLRVRPALDTAEAGLDRVKARIYSVCAKYGLPCPVTGHASSEHHAEQQQQPKPA